MGELIVVWIMFCDVQIVSIEIFIDDVWKQLQDYCLKVLLVFDEYWWLVGIVIQSDLFKYFCFDGSLFKCLCFLCGIKLKMIMIILVVCVQVDIYVVELVLLLFDEGLYCLLVFNEVGYLVGIVSQIDLIVVFYCNWLQYLGQVDQIMQFQCCDQLLFLWIILCSNWNVWCRVGDRCLWEYIRQVGQVNFGVCLICCRVLLFRQLFIIWVWK